MCSVPGVNPVYPALIAVSTAIATVLEHGYELVGVRRLRRGE